MTTVLAAEPTQERGPGVYDDIPEGAYHSDTRSLSHSGAKTLIRSTPAHFRWEREHGRPNKAAFDLGHAAHGLVLGTGAPLAVVDAPDWRTKAAQEAKKAAYAAGEVPILTETYLEVQAMAAAIRAHPLASALFAPGSGRPEQSLYRVDEQTGVTLRARLDWLPTPGPDVLTVADYKTSQSAEPQAFSKSAARFGYHGQHAWYADMVTGLGLAKDVRFLFVVQEVDAPYLVNVVELDDIAVLAGRARNRAAIDLYADCVKHDRWPGYGDGVDLISLPDWALLDLDLDVM